MIEIEIFVKIKASEGSTTEEGKMKLEVSGDLQSLAALVGDKLNKILGQEVA